MHAGVDRFSVELDTSLSEGPPPLDAIGTIQSHLGSHRPVWRWSLRPRGWELDEEVRAWVRRAAPTVYGISLWSGKRWVLKSRLWGRTIEIVLSRAAWDSVRTDIESALGRLPEHHVRGWRELSPFEAGGWGVSSFTRRVLSVAVGLGVGIGWGVAESWGLGVASGLGAALATRADFPSQGHR